jgi:DNA-binding MarR family transcriptional regulator
MEINNGWIKLHRKMQDNPIIMKDADHLAVWMYLLLNATHAEYPALFKGEKIMLKPGQLITGRKSIAAKLSISESKVTRTLKAFENEQQIEQQTSNKNRLISILNWDLYQSAEQQNELQVNNNRTTTEQQVNTNKNVKKNKNVKNERKIYSDIPILNDSILEFVEYRKRMKKPMTDHAVDLMIGKLQKMTPDVNEQVEILNQSIMNGWTGVFPLKKEQTPVRQETVPSWIKPKKNSFNNFHQRSYDADDLEKMLLTTKVNDDP